MSEANEAKQQGSRGDESRKGPGELLREQGSELGDERTTDGREDLDEAKDRASTPSPDTGGNEDGTGDSTDDAREEGGPKCPIKRRA
jgi:hypothetical protein